VILFSRPLPKMLAPFAFIQQVRDSLLRKPKGPAQLGHSARISRPNLLANDDYSGDHYLEHLDSLLKQCKYRSKVYRLSADWAEEKDELK